MKIYLKAFVLGAAVLMAASAANAQQTLLSGTLIPKFVEPLPVAGDIEVVNATLNVPGLPPGTQSFDISTHEFKAQILPTLVNWPTAPATCGGDTSSYTYGYISDETLLNGAPRPSYLGPVVIAERGVPAFPTYWNKLPDLGVIQMNLPIDMTLDWANPLSIDCMQDALGNYTNPQCGGLPYMGPGMGYQGPMPIAAHLHGGEVAPAFDGGPDAWFTPGDAITPSAYTGPGFPGNTYTYDNDQQESTIWFHDHALGITRLNVYAGLAGVWPIIDPANPPLAQMPAFPAYDIPLIIQDRSFDTNCEIFYNTASNPQPNPSVHPFWTPEFIGDTIVVNGKTWPYLNVEPRQYRFRYVNGSNARFYELSFELDKMKANGKLKSYNSMVLPQIAIATDDGYMVNAAATNMIVLAPGERYEVIVDFSAFAGQNIILRNSARTPYPGGGAVIKGQTDLVMQFRVGLAADPNVTEPPPIVAGTPIRPTPLEPILTAHNPATGSITRQLTLNEVIGAGGPLELVVNNSKFNKAGILPGTITPLARETELPAVGDTEIWEIINITADAHPMHIHLVSFQVLERIPFQASKWITNYDALLAANGVLPGDGPPNQYNVRNLDGAIGGNPAISPYYQLSAARGPQPYELGWKDTVVTYPGEVTRVAVRWATTDTPVAAAGEGVNTFPFDPTVLQGGVGYVWHCHIIDHEDNEMMRNYVVGTARQPVL